MRQARGQGIQAGREGAWLGAPTPRAEFGAGAWPSVNAVIHKNSELLHSKEDLASGCLFIYV